MSTGSAIEWTDATWNPVTGCTRVNADCDHCYAVPMSHRLEGMEKARRPVDGTHEKRGAKPGEKYVGLTVLNPREERHFNGVVRCHEDALEIPLSWRKPRRVFVNSMGDLFHKSVPFEFLDKVFAVMALCPRHTFQVLTKRPERMAEYFSSRGGDDFGEPCSRERAVNLSAMKIESERDREAAYFSWPLPNVWLGTSCGHQAAADEMIPHLIKCPVGSGGVRFLSCEPLHGSVDLRAYIGGECDCGRFEHGRCHTECPSNVEKGRIGWVIVGGESGAKARPCDVGWIRSIVGQCKAAGVPCFVKQLGAHPGQDIPTGEDVRMWGDCSITSHDDGVRFWLNDHKGGNMAEWPEDLRVREVPA